MPFVRSYKTIAGSVGLSLVALYPAYSWEAYAGYLLLALLLAVYAKEEKELLALAIPVLWYYWLICL